MPIWKIKTKTFFWEKVLAIRWGSYFGRIEAGLFSKTAMEKKNFSHHKSHSQQLDVAAHANQLENHKK